MIYIFHEKVSSDDYVINDTDCGTAIWVHEILEGENNPNSYKDEFRKIIKKNISFIDWLIANKGFVRANREYVHSW